MDDNKDFYKEVPARNPNVKIPFAIQKFFAVEVDYHNCGFRVLDAFNSVEDLEKKFKGYQSPFDVMCVQHNSVTAIPSSKVFDMDRMAQKCKDMIGIPEKEFKRKSEEFEKYKEEKEKDRRGTISREEWEEIKRGRVKKNIQEKPKANTESSLQGPPESRHRSKYKYAVVSFIQDPTGEGEHAFVLYGLHTQEERAKDHMHDTVGKRIRYSDLFIVDVGSFVYPSDSFEVEGTNLDMDIMYRHQTLNEVRKGLMEDENVHVLRDTVGEFQKMKEEKEIEAQEKLTIEDVTEKNLESTVNE